MAFYTDIISKDNNEETNVLIRFEFIDNHLNNISIIDLNAIGVKDVFEFMKEYFESPNPRDYLYKDNFGGCHTMTIKYCKGYIDPSISTYKLFYVKKNYTINISGEMIVNLPAIELYACIINIDNSVHDKEYNKIKDENKNSIGFDSIYYNERNIIGR